MTREMAIRSYSGVKMTQKEHSTPNLDNVICGVPPCRASFWDTEVVFIPPRPFALVAAADIAMLPPRQPR
jgi:hypothetical protein